MDYGYSKNITLKTKAINHLRKIFFLRPLERFLLKFTKGRQYKTFASKFVPNHYQYSKNSIRKVEREGVNYRLDLSDLVDWYIYYGFKDPSKKALIEKINQGDYVLDIGANMGDLSFSFAKKVGKTGHIFSFEPDRNNFIRLRKNLEINQFKNITSIQKGIGNNPGFYKMAANINEPGNDGSKRIVSAPQDNSENTNLAEIIRLDDWIKLANPSKINLIKMDIEGYEYSAILSASETLNKYSPILYLELHDVKLKEHGSSAIDLCKLIQSFGYQIFDADSNLQVNEKNLINIHDDIVCYKKRNNESS